MAGLTGVVVGAIRQQRHPDSRSRYERGTDPVPSRARSRLVRRERRAELIAIGRKMEHQRLRTRGRAPPNDIPAWPPLATVPTPEDYQRKAETRGKLGERGRRPQGIWTVKHCPRGPAERHHHD